MDVLGLALNLEKIIMKLNKLAAILRLSDTNKIKGTVISSEPS